MSAFFDSLIEKAGYITKQKAATPSVISQGSNDPFAIWKGSRKVDPSKAFDVYSGWVYACIRAIGEEIQKMEFELYEIKKDSDEERVYQSELLDILDAPNESMTGMDMRFMIASHLETCGNAYVYKDGLNDQGKGTPTALYLLDASRVNVVVNKDSFPHRITEYKYKTNETTYTFKKEHIIHFKYPDPSNMFEGIGTVQTAAQWIDADNYAMEFNRRFFLNGARIGGFIEAQQAYTTDQLEYMKKSFENAHKGIENAHKTLALPVGTKYVSADNGQKDMDFTNLMTMMRDRILAAFRVPRTALGITDDVNRANAEATDYVFAARTIVPKMAIITAYLNEYLTPHFGDNIYLGFKDPVPENREATVREMQAALASAPSISVNEAREKFLGLEPIENGDDVMAPFALTPLGKVSGKKAMHKPTKKGSIAKRPAKSKGARNAEKRESIASSIVKAALADMAKTKKIVKRVVKKKNITKLSDTEYEAVYKSFFSRVTPYEKKITSVFEKLNSDQEKEVLANLAGAVKTKAIDEDDLFDYEKAMNATIDLNTPIMEELYSKEGAEAAALLGFKDLNPLNKETKKALDTAIESMARSYTDETLKLLKSKLEQGLVEGASLAQMKELVKDVYAFNDDVRALRVARTEAFRVANEGTKEAWKQTGVVKSIKWYTAADERVCGWCEPMHGRVVDIEKNFYDKGDSITSTDGSSMSLDYADVGAGALHTSCRCYTRPEDISLD